MADRITTMPTAADALPASVEAALGGLLVFPRGEDGEGAPRTLLQWPAGAGVVAWHHSREETRRRLAPGHVGGCGR